MPDLVSRPSGNTLADSVPVSLLMELLRHVPACVGVYAPDGTCLAASAALAAWLARPVDSLVGQGVESIWPGEFGRQQRGRLAEALRGPGVRGTEEFPSALGGRRVKVARFAWREGPEVRGVVEVFEEQAAQVSRAETIGRLVLGVTHDFNNALTVIQGHADLLASALSRGVGADVALADLRRAVEHASQLPRQLLRFVREETQAGERIDVNALLDSIQSLLRPRLGRAVRFRLEPAPGGAWIEGDPGQLTQVLLNLALNALEAMPDGGELTVRAVALESCVRLTITDTGRGMTHEVQQQMFEPLFTTRPNGNGLGLFMAREIVQRHAGRLSCQSAPGRGTTFMIDLPVRSRQRAAAASDPGGRGTTVLVIERDPDIRQLTGMILSHGGYRPLLCGDLSEARREADAHGDPVRLLLLDAELLATRGEDEMAELLTLFPTAGLLYLSTGHLVARDSDGPKGLGVVAKPFRAEQLLRAVEVALRGL